MNSAQPSTWDCTGSGWGTWLRVAAPSTTMQPSHKPGAGANALRLPHQACRHELYVGRWDGLAALEGGAKELGFRV